jgi:hypothetical protein
MSHSIGTSGTGALIGGAGDVHVAVEENAMLHTKG